ncbi:hypothetical protein E5P55_00425 [Candidatus Pinguicoccus supinus]|uniref:Uncharacterized protein n=1 Tax=Candidatus Pinguicoccus supinus TaxID=2529394 RepID=A0A7T0BRH3_9BACT|nr:hypothetical protein E5P55_00425 [Candidatus Pinguicoccus supinus]
MQNNYFKLNPLKIYYIFNYITLASSWNVEIYIHKISYLLGLPYIVLINKYNKYIFSVFKKVKCIFYVYNRVQQNPLDEVCKILLYFYNPKGLLNQLVVFLDFSNINILLQFKYIIKIKNAPSFLNSTFYPSIYIYNQIKLNLNLYIKDILKSKLK